MKQFSLRPYRPLMLVLLVALTLRLALSLVALPHPERAFSPDTASYLDFANRILSGQGWEYPSAIRTPVYPLFLAGVMAVAGETAFLIILAQILVSLANIGLTYWLASEIFDAKVALLSALLLAVSMESITHAFYLLTETLFTFLFLLSTVFLWRAKRTASWKLSLVAGIFLGLGILTRPLVLYYPWLASAFLFLDPAPLQKRLANTLLFLASCGLVLAPWMARNEVVIGRPVVSTITENNLLYYNAATLQARDTGKNEDVVRQELSARVTQTLQARGLANNEANRSEVEGELARQILLADPVRYAAIHLKSDLNSLLPDTDLLEIVGLNAGQSGTLNVLKQEGLIPAIRHYFGGRLWMITILLPAILLLGIVYLGWGIAAIQMIWERRFLPLFFLSLPVFYCLFLPGSPSNPRFRVPVMPMIVILSSVGLYALAGYLRTRYARSQGKFIRTGETV